MKFICFYTCFLLIFLLFSCDEKEFDVVENFVDTNAVVPESKIDENNYFVADVLPRVPGGLKELEKKIDYPNTAKRNGIQGTVIISCTIDNEGNVIDTKIIKAIGGGCEEAVRKVLHETKFIPGKTNGKPVVSTIALPFRFELQ